MFIHVGKKNLDRGFQRERERERVFAKELKHLTRKMLLNVGDV